MSSRSVEDLPNELLGVGEVEVSLELVDHDFVAAGFEGVARLDGTHDRGADAVSRVAPPDHVGGVRPGAVGVQCEVLREPRANRDAAHAVAALVERWREHADAELAGEHRDHPAGDAALRREPNVVCPSTGVVVHPARLHHAEHVLDVAFRERPRCRWWG